MTVDRRVVENIYSQLMALAHGLAVLLDSDENSSHEGNGKVSSPPIEPENRGEISRFEGADVGMPVAQIVRTYVQDPVLPSDPVLPEVPFDLVRTRTRQIYAGSVAEELFTDFWEAYPRKVGKKDARKAFFKLNPSPGLVEIFKAAIERQRRSDQWCRGFIPHPTTWLHDERWTDELPTEPAISGPMTRGERIAAVNKQTFHDVMEMYRHADAVSGGRIGGADAGAPDPDDPHAGGIVRRDVEQRADRRVRGSAARRPDR